MIKNIKCLSILLCFLIFIFYLPSCSIEKKQQFTVTFDSNGGSEVSVQVVDEGDTIYKPRNPEKNGYVFDAWYYDDQKWNFSTQTITQDINLIAKWFKLPADKIAYVLNDDYTAYYVDDYLGDDYNVVISETYRGLPVVKIGDWAFADTKIRTITIPQSVTEIGENAFSCCDYLQKIDLPSSINSIGFGAFQNCEDLTSLIIPENVAFIGQSVLFRCSALKTLSVHEDNKHYDSRNDCNAIIESKSNKLIEGCSRTVIPDTVTTIGRAAFEKKAMRSLSIPRSVKKIETYAFAYSDNIQYIYIPKTVEEIEYGAFGDCLNLTIYCEVSARPEKWSANWNKSHNQVVWNYKEKE